MVTAAGIRLDLTGPRPVTPPHSLIRTPGVVQDGPARWLNGVNVVGFPEDIPLLWEPCSEGTFRDKDEGTERPQATFDAFVAYLPVSCSTFGAAELPEQAEAVLEATVSMAAEEAISQGIFGSSNPYFADANLSVLGGGGALLPQTGLAYLENAIGATGRGGMIHATPAIVSALDLDKMTGDGPLITANGTLVVSGDGYIDINPDGTPPAPAAGQDYMFATGPVEIRLGPVIITDLAESLDRSDNSVTFRAERYVLATWDTSLQAAVLVDWSP